MKLLRLIYKRETMAPIFALTFASAAGVLLVSARVVWTGNLQYAFLVWNLFLAWLPLVFAMLAREALREGRTRWRFFSFSAAWLLFFPNAPYIFTDMIHLMYGRYQHFWVDLTMILLCALTGLVLGFVSLYLMQSVVTRRFGCVAGWLFVATAAGLCSVGIFLGRFLRFNSWDVILRPGKIYRGFDAWADGRMMNGSSAAFLVLFATFLFITYVMLYALTHLQPTHLMPAEIANGKAANS
jgi:uncharacterized membrane protein